MENTENTKEDSRNEFEYDEGEDALVSRPSWPHSRTPEHQDPNEQQQRDENSMERSTGRTIAIMFALALAIFLSALDITIVTTALPTIASHFQSKTVYTWVGSAYLLAVAATTIIWGKLSDVFGRKPVLLLANIVFFIGSLVAALSVNAAMLLVARAIQGCGGGGLNVLVNICIGDLFSPRRRGAFYGINTAVWAVALSLGPVIGGALAQDITWRWCFYINLPFDGLAFLIIFFLVDLETPRTPLWKGLKAIDWIGAALSVGATLMILLGLSFGGTIHPWSSVTVICLIVFGVIAWCLCLPWELYGARFPLLPFRIFKHKNAIALLAVCFIQNLVYISAPYYLPLYFQIVLAADPILSGVYLIPIAVALSLASIGTGQYMRRTGKYRIPMVAGFVLQTLGFGLFINLGSTANWAKIILYQAIAGLGVGPNFQAPMIALQTHVSPSNLATATSTFAFVRFVAASVSVVIGQVVFSNRMRTQYSTLAATLGPSLASSLAGPAAGSEADVLRTLPQHEQNVAHTAFTNSFKYLWIMYMAFSGAGLVVSLLVGTSQLSTRHQEARTGLEAEQNRKDDALKWEQERKIQESAVGEKKCHPQS